MEHSFFFAGLAFIAMHEMDAIRCKEWRIFPGLSLLDDQKGFITFTFAHIPLVYWMLLEVKRNNENFMYYFDIFLIVHFFLHLLFLKHSKNEFKDWISWTIITGAAVCGLLDLVVV